ncbi:bifunctional helix-turn-helix transcriptional regulator/GNAT family N-acetyltransferase [Streptomyces lydicus]
MTARTPSDTPTDTSSDAPPDALCGARPDAPADVRELRRFNRFYTNLIGALDYGRHLYTPFTLTEARVLYEVANQPRVDAADLRASLSLDAGYLSRLLGKFEDRELITRGRSEQDSRRQRITLTEDGREAAGLLEERSQDAAGTLLRRLPVADRTRLVEAMRTVRALLEEGSEQPGEGVEEPGKGVAQHGKGAEQPGQGAEQPGQGVRQPRGGRTPGVVLRTSRAGDLGWMVERNAALYAAEYGFDLSYEALVARIVAEYAEDFDPRWDRTWIAELGGQRVGAVMCVRDGRPGVARLRLLLVEPDARGHGTGRQLVHSCIGFAREAGYGEMVLWTNSVLGAARALYQRAGFELVAESPHHSFGQDLIGQDWRLML